MATKGVTIKTTVVNPVKIPSLSLMSKGTKKTTKKGTYGGGNGSGMTY